MRDKEKELEDVGEDIQNLKIGYRDYCRSGTKVDVSTIIACFISYCESSHELILTLSEENDKLRKEVDRIKITHLF